MVKTRMVTNQAYLFLIFVLNGILIGLLFDFFRILRRSFSGKDWITYLEDVLFWILTGAILLYSIFAFNNGEIRLFMLIGVLLGGIFYLLTVSKYIIKISVIIIKAIKNVINKIFNILFLPFKYFYKLLRKLFFKPISFIFINVRKNSTNLAKKIASFIQENKILKKSVKIEK